MAISGLKNAPVSELGKNNNEQVKLNEEDILQDNFFHERSNIRFVSSVELYRVVFFVSMLRIFM